MAGYCSLVILCIGAAAALSAMALVAIAAFTDHWVEVLVDREVVKEVGRGDEQEIVFFSRHRGLFRVCFPGTEQGKRPDKHPEIFLSLVEDWCISRDYRTDMLMRGSFIVPDMTEQGLVQLQLTRSTPALLFGYMVLMTGVGLLGLIGCWQQSANKLIWTAAIQLLAALVGATAMATWHAALFMEMEKVHEPGFPLTWPNWLQAATRVGTGWSYLVAWAGVCLTLVASLATSASAIALRAQRRSWEEDAMRMKLRLSSMLAGHTYYPGAKHHAGTLVQEPVYRPSGYSPRGSRPPSNGPDYNLRSAYSRESLTTPSTDMSTFVDYKKVLGELENSRF